MQTGRSGMGSRKHGKSGLRNGPGKSPKMRHGLKREAEQNVRRQRKTTTRFRGSVRELLKGK